MAYAFCLRFDDATDAAVRAIWQALAAGGADDTMLQLGYPPHLTLATLDQEPPRAVVETALDAIADLLAFGVKLGGVNCFAGTSIAWLAADGGMVLADLHARLLDVLPGSLVREHYRVGRWTPHVTLQMQGDVGTGMEIAGELWPQAVDARVVALELVQFPPVVALKSVLLA